MSRPNLDAADISAFNLAQVASVLADCGVPGTDIRFAVAALDITTVPLDEDGEMRAGLLRGAERQAVRLRQRPTAAPVLTADRTWATLNLNVEVRLTR